MGHEVWAVGNSYENYVGRWSRSVAREFVKWLAVSAGGRWLDVGCGTGALSAVVLATAEPAEVVGVDPSEGFLATARTANPRAEFRLGDAAALPVASGEFGAVVSGLALNFMPDAARAAAEFARAAAPSGVVAAYVWDYAAGMEMMRYCWDAAVDLDPAVADVDEGRRFPICQPDALTRLWTGAGLRDVTTRAIDVPTVFENFDDYWTPFLGGQGAAPGYVMSLSGDHRDALRESLRTRLPVEADGSIRLTARAWAVRGVCLSAAQ
ncbi:SAM-dependent methyltransferase [Actinosynnema sp. ALI-1.44]|uniref:class I SAM-dependent methyltransferase n=1 Tax=Actinosynnema sp. ALI-1.44 TaxID=1933779 RepID=UPI00097CB789|nr:class I SAM-dependent methyltransferase [Actinosynnema sp. ALI-1.44]ONI90382.1 SAM-dependent methyltransferase [Actinosynnema sp. ALI-1.44]